MRRKWMIFLIIIIAGLIFSILWGPTLLYKPITPYTERVFLFDYQTNENETTFEALNVSSYIKVMETESFDIVEIYFYDQVILGHIAQDFKNLVDILKTINFDKPLDLTIIEQSDDLELTINARFGKSLLYEQKTINVSKYFNVILPITGGISFSNLFPLLQIFVTAGYLDGAHNNADINYNNPAIISYKITKENLLGQQKIWDMLNYRIHFGNYVFTNEIVNNTTHMVLIPER